MTLLCPGLLLCALSLQPDAALKLAAQWQEAGRYELAAALYDQFAPPHRWPRGEFYLAQGNAHFLAGHLAEAIRAYRRADRLLYRHARVQANLAEARAWVQDAPAQGWRLPGRLEEHAAIALALYLLAWGALGRWVQRPTRGRLLLAVVLFGSLLGSSGLVLRQYVRARHQPFGIVAAAELVLRRGNGESYPPVLAGDAPVRLHYGAEVSVRMGRKNGWLQVELASGVVGWLPRDAVLLDFEPILADQAPGRP